LNTTLIQTSRADVERQLVAYSTNTDRERGGTKDARSARTKEEKSQMRSAMRYAPCVIRFFRLITYNSELIAEHGVLTVQAGLDRRIFL
jgi:hypothetical protein